MRTLRKVKTSFSFPGLPFQLILPRFAQENITAKALAAEQDVQNATTTPRNARHLDTVYFR